MERPTIRATGEEQESSAVSEALSVLVLANDDDATARRVRALLAANGEGATTVRSTTLASGTDSILAASSACILLDARAGDDATLLDLDATVRLAPLVPLIAVTRGTDRRFDAEVIRRGAQDTVELDQLDGSGLRRAITHAVARKEAENRCIRDGALYRSIVDGSPDLIAVVDEVGVLKYVNAAAGFLAALDRDGCAARNLFDSVHPDDVESVLRKFATVRALPGLTVPMEFRLATTLGEWRTIEVFTVNHLDEPHVAGVILHARDVTEHRRVEAALAASNRDLQAATDAQETTLQQLERGVDQLVEALALTAEWRDPLSAGHQRGVARFAGAVAREMGCDPAEIKGIEMAATIHDIGLIGVPQAILDKRVGRTEAETELFRRHPQIGYDIVAHVEFGQPVAEMIRQHHEFVDGSGYPAGLRGSEILRGARIIAVADVVEAMILDRTPYAAPTPADVLAHLERGRGTRFDSDVVDACARLCSAGGFRLDTAAPGAVTS